MADSTAAFTRRKFLHRVYTEIPHRYDLINHIMTLGFDARWRRQAARECLANNPQRVLDLGCGTGDLTLELAAQATDNTNIMGIDFSPSMLEVAKEKAKGLFGAKKPSFVSGDAAALPFPEEHFDSIGSAFAFRNMTYKNPAADGHIAEVLRVIKCGGRFVVIETSQPKQWLIRKLNHLYIRFFVFWLSYLLSGKRATYGYLVESSVNYYSAEELKQKLLKAGFNKVSFRRLFFGAVCIHTAIK